MMLIKTANKVFNWELGKYLSQVSANRVGCKTELSGLQRRPVVNDWAIV